MTKTLLRAFIDGKLPRHMANVAFAEASLDIRAAATDELAEAIVAVGDSDPAFAAEVFALLLHMRDHDLSLVWDFYRKIFRGPDNPPTLMLVNFLKLPGFREFLEKTIVVYAKNLPHTVK